MSSIKVINTIRLCSKGVLAKDANGKYVKLHKRQGDMDGACSVYSLAMALLCLGVVTEDDLNIYNKPDRTRLGKERILLFNTCKRNQRTRLWNYCNTKVSTRYQ